MMDSDEFICLNPDVIESDTGDISTAITSHISSNKIECLVCIRDCQI